MLFLTPNQQCQSTEGIGMPSVVMNHTMQKIEIKGQTI